MTGMGMVRCPAIPVPGNLLRGMRNGELRGGVMQGGSFLVSDRDGDNALDGVANSADLGLPLGNWGTCGGRRVP